MTDDARETLLLPFETGRLAVPGTGTLLFLRARPGRWPADWRMPDLTAVQSFAPLAQALARQGVTTMPLADARGGHALVLALPPRQREEARALLAEAVAQAEPGALVVAAAANNEGARTIEADLAGLIGPVESLSKNKARVFWGRTEAVDAGLLAEWRMLDAPRAIGDGRFWSRPGLFAWDRIDAGSALLAEVLPETLSGHGADLGAGFGYLAAQILKRCARVKALDLYEAEKRALDLAEHNLADETRPLRFFWADVTAGLADRYDFIVTNPPFHTGRADRADLGQAFIERAAQALVPGGRLVLVANRHLPYEAVLQKHFAEIQTLADRQGYKVILARRAGR